MDRLTPEDVARARGLLAQALPPRREPKVEPAPEPGPVDPRKAAERARIEEYAARIVADWPPLTAEQIDKIRAIMRPTLQRPA